MVCLILAPELELHREIRGKKSFRGRGLPTPERNASSPAAYPTGKPSHVSWMPFLQDTAHSFIFPMAGRIDLVPPLQEGNLEGVGMVP